MNQAIQFIPAWSILGGLSFASIVIGLFISKKLWGKNSRKLQKSLDDSVYLASQWATLGISQSQLVEKLGERIERGTNELGSVKNALLADVRERDLSIQRLEGELEKLVNSKSSLTGHDVEVLETQAAETQKREQRIKTLEARLHYIDSQTDQQVSDHQNQVKVLLERIAVFEASGTHSEEEIVKNNLKLTENLKARCDELEVLRDEVCAKEMDVAKLREQNDVIQKQVDDLMAAWSKKKGQSREIEEVKEKLTDASKEVSRLKKEQDRKSAEMEILKQELAGRNIDVPQELISTRTELVETRNELKNWSDQVGVLLEVISQRDSKVEQLESLVTAGGKQAQIKVLTQTIADLQNNLTATEEALRSKSTEVDDLMSDGKSSSNRVITEAKSGGRRQSLIDDMFRGDSAIYFGESSSHVTQENLELIKGIAKEVLESGCQISLTGFSDDEGNPDFNDTLSSKRAEAVQKRFGEMGVDSSLIILRGKGQDFGVSVEDSWQARRVEIVVLPVAEIVN